MNLNDNIDAKEECFQTPSCLRNLFVMISTLTKIYIKNNYHFELINVSKITLTNLII